MIRSSYQKRAALTLFARLRDLCEQRKSSRWTRCGGRPSWASGGSTSSPTWAGRAFPAWTPRSSSRRCPRAASAPPLTSASTSKGPACLGPTGGPLGGPVRVMPDGCRFVAVWHVAEVSFILWHGAVTSGDADRCKRLLSLLLCVLAPWFHSLF